MTLIVGIDPSTKKIAITARCDEPPLSFAKSYVLLKPRDKQDMASLGRALDVMADFVQWANQVAPVGERLAWVEDPLVGRGGVTTTMKQALVGGIIRGTLHNAGFDVRNANVSTWKKAVTGNGRSQKPAVAQAVFAKWPKIRWLVEDDSDLIDAAAITLYGAGLHKQDGVVRGDARSSRGSVQGGRRPGSVVRKARLRR